MAAALFPIINQAREFLGGEVDALVNNAGITRAIIGYFMKYKRGISPGRYSRSMAV
jgi:NAD(P)-dependent dehydrogenase (short-subunit alcohol dehydrogenase family)